MLTYTFFYLSLLSCTIFYVIPTQTVGLAPSSWFTRSYTEVIPTKEYTVQPHTALEIKNIEGSITIKSWDQNNKITLDITKKGTEAELKDTPISINTNQGIHIATQAAEGQSIATVNYTLTVPEDIYLKFISTERGNVTIDQVYSPLHVTVGEGNINIQNATKTVIAKTNKGSITLRQRKLIEPNTIFLETLKGNVTLYLPKTSNSTLFAHTASGTVTSEHAITLESITTKLNKEFWNSMKQDAKGTIGTGGAPITIDVTKGNIVIAE